MCLMIYVNHVLFNFIIWKVLMRLRWLISWQVRYFGNPNQLSLHSDFYQLFQEFLVKQSWLMHLMLLFSASIALARIEQAPRAMNSCIFRRCEVCISRPRSQQEVLRLPHWCNLIWSSFAGKSRSDRQLNLPQDPTILVSFYCTFLKMEPWWAYSQP